MKNVYLIVTDLHYNTHKEHRLNYFGEVLSVVQQLMSLCDEYKGKGYAVYIVFLGDIVDSAITQAEDAMRCQDLFNFIRSQVSGIFTVLGNHEEHNVSDNPFWFLVSELEDDALLRLAKPLQPKGVNSIIRVPEVIHDGKVTLYFNHYGIPAKVPSGDDEVAIGLFHQNVGSNDICKMWGTFDDVEQASYIQPYNYCFFGHMHLAIGKYYLNEAKTCLGEWLGTCVGTNVNEVQTLPRELNIPAIVVDNGELTGIEDNTVTRSDPKSVIDYSRLEISKASSELLTQCQHLLLKPSIGDSLFDRVHAAAEDVQMGFLVDMLVQSYDVVRYEYLQGLRNTIIADTEEDVTNDSEHE